LDDITIDELLIDSDEPLLEDTLAIEVDITGAVLLLPSRDIVVVCLRSLGYTQQVVADLMELSRKPMPDWQSF